jgi:hypothetical protein
MRLSTCWCIWPGRCTSPCGSCAAVACSGGLRHNGLDWRRWLKRRPSWPTGGGSRVWRTTRAPSQQLFRRVRSPSPSPSLSLSLSLSRRPRCRPRCPPSHRLLWAGFGGVRREPGADLDLPATLDAARRDIAAGRPDGALTVAAVSALLERLGCWPDVVHPTRPLGIGEDGASVATMAGLLAATLDLAAPLNGLVRRCVRFLPFGVVGSSGPVQRPSGCRGLGLVRAALARCPSGADLGTHPGWPRALSRNRWCVPDRDTTERAPASCSCFGPGVYRQRACWRGAAGGAAGCRRVVDGPGGVGRGRSRDHGRKHGRKHGVRRGLSRRRFGEHPGGRALRRRGHHGRRHAHPSPARRHLSRANLGVCAAVTVASPTSCSVAQPISPALLGGRRPSSGSGRTAEPGRDAGKEPLLRRRHQVGVDGEAKPSHTTGARDGTLPVV